MLNRIFDSVVFDLWFGLIANSILVIITPFAFFYLVRQKSPKGLPKPIYYLGLAVIAVVPFISIQSIPKIIYDFNNQPKIICGEFENADEESSGASANKSWSIEFSIVNNSNYFTTSSYYQDFFNNLEKKDSICFEQYTFTDKVYNLKKN